VAARVEFPTVFIIVAEMDFGITVPQKSHELFRDLLRQKNAKKWPPYGPVAIVIYKWASLPAITRGGAPNPLERVRQLHCLTQDHRIADWICAQAGGFFVSNAVAPSRAGKEPGRASTPVREFAGMLSAIAKAALEESISDSEAVAIRCGAEAAIDHRAVCAIVRDAEFFAYPQSRKAALPTRRRAGRTRGVPRRKK